MVKTPVPVNTYRIRYRIEEWNKPAEDLEAKAVQPGIRKSTTDYGFADEVLVASILNYGTPDVTVLLVDSVSMACNPPRELLVLVRDVINHFLEEHCAEE
jgi:hypothetical protein